MVTEDIMRNFTEFDLPAGYFDFHKDKTLNFQLNRWYSFGYARYSDFVEAGKRIRGFDDWAGEMTKIAGQAEEEGRMLNAGFYYRAAEFFLGPADEQKTLLYNKFQSILHKLLKVDGIRLEDVPFEGSVIPCLKSNALGDGAKGTIVIHGGFDSFKEEFFSAINYFSVKGYDVIVFDGPGQGEARRKHGLAFDYRWERPTSAVIDYFNLEDVTLIGVSLGGYLCFRAAAFEPRIKRIIASSVAYDYTDVPPKMVQPLIRLFYHKFTNFTNNASLKQMEKGGFQSWYLTNLVYMQKAKKPIDAIQYLTEMDAEALHCGNITQDVLILTGRDDHLTPFKMHKKQVKALTNAKSVTAKVFYKNSYAGNHCQIGNMKLNFDTMAEWMDTVQ